MLWSMLKIVVFVAIAAVLAFAAVRLLETPGEVRIAFDGREFQVTPIGFVVGLVLLVIAALLLLKILGFFAALVRFLLGDETAITRYFSRNRERRGLDALSGSMLALASGEAGLASRKAAKAEKLLQRPEIGLVKAQAAEMSGDRKAAMAAYTGLVGVDRTRFAGINGAMRLKLEEGQTDTALELAKKAFALRPDNVAILDTLFDLQCKTGDWAGARATLNAKMHARLLPRDVGRAARCGAVARGSAQGERRGGCGARTYGGVAGQQAGADAGPGRGACLRGACGGRVEAPRLAGARHRLDGEPAPRYRRSLCCDRAGRVSRGASQALPDVDRRRAEPSGQPAPRRRACAC